MSLKNESAHETPFTVTIEAREGVTTGISTADQATTIRTAVDPGKGKADIRYQFSFTTKIRNPKTFLYNTGQITDIADKTWNRPQFYSVTRWEGSSSRVLARNLACPPVNVGPRSTPNYAKLAKQAVHSMGNRSVFAGQRGRSAGPSPIKGPACTPSPPRDPTRGPR